MNYLTRFDFKNVSTANKKSKKQIELVALQIISNKIGVHWRLKHVQSDYNDMTYPTKQDTKID